MRVNNERTRAILSAIGYVAFTVLFGLFMGVIVVEWLVGCGEKIYYADGTWVTGECVFVPYETTTGEWG